MSTTDCRKHYVSCLSVRPSVRPSVRSSVAKLVNTLKTKELNMTSVVVLKHRFKVLSFFTIIYHHNNRGRV